MSLDWNVERLDPDLRAAAFPPDDEGKMHNHLHNAIWVTQAVGIGQVTKLNYREFYMRQVIWVKVIGPLFNEMVPPSDGGTGDWSPIILTLNECRALIGLHTNVSPRTRTQFNASVWNELDHSTKVSDEVKARRGYPHSRPDGFH